MKIKKIINSDIEKHTWDIEVPEYHYYTLSNGVKSHNSLSNSFPIPCISSGVEPIIGPYYWRKTRAIKNGEWSFYFTIPDRVKFYLLEKMDSESDDYKKLFEFNGTIEDNNGKIGNEFIEIINKYLSQGFFKPAHEIDYKKKLKLLSGLYNWIDAAISCTFNLPETATIEDVKTIYQMAYDNDVRAVSVYKEGSREGILIFEDPIINKQKHKNKQVICEDRPESILYSCAPKRPKTLPCNIHHCTVRSEKWLVLVGLLNNEPYEIFAGEQEDIFISKNVKNGEIIKKGNGIYSLKFHTRKSVVEYDDIAIELMTAEQRSITRIISLCLRHGIPYEFITEQLKKANSGITDFSNVVSRILSKYIKEYYFSKSENCPICKELLLKQEGCMKCLSCGYSRCG